MRKGIALLAAASLLGIAACGDDEEESGAGEARSLSVVVDRQGKLTGIESLEGGLVKIDFRNGARAPYDLQLIKVDGDQTVEQVLRVIESDRPTPIPSWMHGAGGVGTTRPNQTRAVTQVLPPGKYFAIASADTEGDGPKPSTATLQVEGGEDSGELPATDATVTASEYEFAADGLKPGTNRVRFVNEGKELHHVLAFPLRPGKTVADVKQFFRTERGQPPVDFESETGTAVLDTKQEQVVDLNLAKPGKYALICFIPDRKGGPPHAAKGMISEVEVAAS